MIVLLLLLLFLHKHKMEVIRLTSACCIHLISAKLHDFANTNILIARCQFLIPTNHSELPATRRWHFHSWESKWKEKKLEKNTHTQSHHIFSLANWTMFVAYYNFLWFMHCFILFFTSKKCVSCPLIVKYCTFFKPIT